MHTHARVSAAWQMCGAAVEQHSTPFCSHNLSHSFLLTAAPRLSSILATAASVRLLPAHFYF